MKELFIATKNPKAPNFTPAQEARLEAAAAEHGTLNAALAAELATEMGKTTRSIIAKIVRMELPYTVKQPTTKTGEPVASKATIVAEIAAVVGGNLEGLEKAPKAALHALRRFVGSREG